MKKGISPYLVLSVVLLAIVLSIIFSAETEEPCEVVKTIHTSAIVDRSSGGRHIGFDLNKQNLTFGTLSPGATSGRAASVGYSKNATVYVWAEGNFSSWILISPNKFEIEPTRNQEVKFTLHVPHLAKAGEFNGEIVFCYQDR